MNMYLWILNLTDYVGTRQMEYPHAALHGGLDGLYVQQIHLKQFQSTLCSFHLLQMLRLILILCVYMMCS